jgi:PilZ domain-containing protein
MESYFHEKRKESRVYVRFPATIRWKAPADKELVEQSHTFSISGTGASFFSSKLIPVGQKIKVTLDVGGHSGSSDAVVRWATPEDDNFKVGVSFHT